MMEQSLKICFKTCLSRNKYKILNLGSKNQLWVYKMETIAFYGQPPPPSQEILVNYNKLIVKHSSKTLAPNAYIKLHQIGRREFYSTLSVIVRTLVLCSILGVTF